MGVRQFHVVFATDVTAEPKPYLQSKSLVHVVLLMIDGNNQTT